MRRLLLVSPHFPPDASAGAHRARLLAPHLPAAGWLPTVLTVDERGYEGALDRGLAGLVPGDLEVVRARAWPARATRRLGVGDLGLRSFAPLWVAARRLLDERRYDAVLITLYPTYTAMLGPLLVRRRPLPLVLDYQDPWVSAWGDTVGPGGTPDARARLTRALALRLEPRALAATTAVTAVSRGTWEGVTARHPGLARPFLELPIGFDPADLAAIDARAIDARREARSDGLVHLVSVGTLLPLAMDTLRALLSAVAALRQGDPAAAARLRLRFLGTSNQRDPAAPARVLPVARALGVDDLVTEVAPRLDYADALAAQREADALLLVGSSEPHYTASRLFPALLARRPLLALYHEASSVSAILGAATRAPTVRLVTFDEARPALSQVPAITAALRAIVEGPEHRAYHAADVNEAALSELAAPALARRLGAFLDAACDRFARARGSAGAA